MDTKNITHISIAILLLATIALSLIPAIHINLKGEYAGVPPRYVDDDLDYYARIKEVADGQPFIGNPYFIEHKDDPAASFFVADWMVSLPLVFGLSLSRALLFNFIFWSLVFVVLAFFIGRALNMPAPHSAAGALLAYCEVYWLILRPVVMQQVFPFFLFFLLALLIWMNHPFRRRSIYILGVAGALSFYVYPFLWQIVISVLGVIFIHYLIKRSWPEVRTLLYIGLVIILIASPILIYTFYQTGHPFYFETVRRVGLYDSYLPTLDAYFYGRWAIILTVLFFLIKKWTGGTDKSFKAPHSVVLYSGMGLIIATVSNVITGKEMMIGQHIGRFIILWFAIFFTIAVRYLWVYRRQICALSWLKLTAIVSLYIISSGFLVLNLDRSIPFRKIFEMDISYIQTYAEPLNWLEDREEQPVVILANEDISSYIPILTKHYVFWSHSGSLHIMSTSEIEDRFLFSKFGKLTAEDLIRSYSDFQGAGPERRYRDRTNKAKLSCLLGADCQSTADFSEWIGGEKIKFLLDRQRELQKDKAALIKKYQIVYAVAEIKNGEDVLLGSLPGAQGVWRNEGFVIYKIN